MRLFITVCILMLITAFSFSQEVGEEVRDGQRFKIHVVEAGNTLYGLHKKYNAPIEDIIKENPEAANGLKIGQRLYIPVEGKPQNQKIHIVKKKETLFGISRLYNCSINKLMELNPGLEEGLKVGQELIVPSGETVENTDVINDKQEANPNEVPKDTVKYEVDFQDSTINYTVQKGETLYSISRRYMVPVEKLVEDNNIKRNKIKPGQVITIALKKERIETVPIKKVQRQDSIVKDTLKPHFEKKESYRIAVLLPLRIQENQEVLSGLYDEDTRLDQLTNISLDFLMGVQMALDSLEKLGLTAEVEFFDTRGDEKRLETFFKDADEVDLIIGPFYPNLVEKTADWCKRNQVRMVAVSKIPTKVLRNNPYVHAVVPSELTLIAAMAEYVATHHSDDNLFLITSSNEEIKSRNELFKSVYQANAPENAHTIKEMGIGSADGRELFRAIDEDTTTLFICLEKEVKDVMVFVNALNAAKNYSARVKNANVFLVGTQEWLDYEAFNSYYRNRFEFHFAASNYLNYDLDSTIQFVRAFRDRYEADPSRYAVHGFDVVLAQGASLLLGIDRNDGVMDSFNLQPIKKGHGEENTTAFISKQKEYVIRLLDIIANNNYFEAASTTNN